MDRVRQKWSAERWHALLLKGRARCSRVVLLPLRISVPSSSRSRLRQYVRGILDYRSVRLIVSKSISS